MLLETPSPSWSRMSVTITVAPSFANARAMASPMPRAEPEINATLFCSRTRPIMSGLLLLRHEPLTSNKARVDLAGNKIGMLQNPLVQWDRCIDAFDDEH